MTQIDLEVVEYEGGYQDRNGNKSGRLGASLHLYLRVEGSVMKAILLWVWGSDLGGLRRLLRKCCVPVLTNLGIFDLGHRWCTSDGQGFVDPPIQPWSSLVHERRPRFRGSTYSTLVIAGAMFRGSAA
jgi:hypothetical protein